MSARPALPFLLCAALAAAIAPGCGWLGGDEAPKKKKGKKKAASEEPAEPQVGADDPTARKPVRAGEGDAGTAEKLDNQVKKLIDAVPGATPAKAAAVLTPHGGVKHSGPTAAEVWARVEVPPVVVILAPNHWNDGERLAVWTEGPWLVPGHALAVDAELTARLRHHMPDLKPDRAAFGHHEVELLLPFLQYKRPDVRLVVVAMRDNEKKHYPQTSVDEITKLGAGLAAFLQELDASGTEHLLLMTTDLSHYVPQAKAQADDTRLMDHIVRYDVEGLYQSVTTDKISICGELPVSVGMDALRRLGRPAMQWHTLGNNLHSSKKPDAVVGYPGAILWR